MTNQNSESSTQKVALQKINSGLSITDPITDEKLIELSEFIRLLKTDSALFVVTFHLDAHAVLKVPIVDKHHYHVHSTVAHVVYVIGNLLSNTHTGYRVQNFIVNNAVNRYTVELLIRSVGLYDLVAL